MHFMPYRHGLILVTAISFGLWLAASSTQSCFFAMIVEGAEISPDARLGGCDSAFTAGLRTLAGDMYRKPFYDVIYDVNFSFLWLFGIAFAAWFLVHKLYLQRQTISHTGSAVKL